MLQKLHTKKWGFLGKVQPYLSIFLSSQLKAIKILSFRFESRF